LKPFILTFVVFISLGARCVSSSPSALQRDRDGSSGIKGTTASVVISGVPGGPTIGGPTSIEFAIAPVEADKPVYNKVIFVKSDVHGMFKVELPPGTYWIGPKAKALDPIQYVPGSVVFSEMVVVVKERSFVHVDLLEAGVAP